MPPNWQKTRTRMAPNGNGLSTFEMGILSTYFLGIDGQIIGGLDLRPDSNIRVNSGTWTRVEFNTHSFDGVSVCVALPKGALRVDTTYVDFSCGLQNNTAYLTVRNNSSFSFMLSGSVEFEFIYNNGSIARARPGQINAHIVGRQPETICIGLDPTKHAKGCRVNSQQVRRLITPR